MITEMYALMHRFGLASVFGTFSPDDTNHSISIRMCSAIYSNNIYPATAIVTGMMTLAEAIEHEMLLRDDQTIASLKIPFSQNAKCALAAMNPVTVARCYSKMQEIVFEDLLGISIHCKNSIKTLPRVDASLVDEPNPIFLAKYKAMYTGKYFSKNQPVLAQALAALAVNEEHKKKTLHTHFLAMTTLKPELLQSIAGHTFLQSHICRIIDSMFKAEVPAHLHFRYAVSQEINKFPGRRMTRDYLSVISTETIASMSNAVVMNTGIHGHIHPGACTPKKVNFEGKLLCRFGKPNVLSDSTKVSIVINYLY